MVTVSGYERKRLHSFSFRPRLNLWLLPSRFGIREQALYVFRDTSRSDVRFARERGNDYVDRAPRQHGFHFETDRRGLRSKGFIIPVSILRRASNPHPAFGTPLPRAGEGRGVRARRAALAMRELVWFALHAEMVTTLSGNRLGQ